MRKTNIDHLRDLIKDNDEACEFLDAVQKDLDEANDGWDESDREKKSIQERSDEIERELNAIKEDGPGNIIRTPQGNIKWQADNLQHMAIFEALEDVIKYKSPLEIEAAIKAL